MNAKCLPIITLVFLFFSLTIFSQQDTKIDTSALNQKGRLLLEEKLQAKTREKEITLLQEAFVYFQEAKNGEMLVEVTADLALQYFYIQDYKLFDEQIRSLKILLKTYTVPDETHFFAQEILAWDAQTKEDYFTSEQLYKELFDYAIKKSDKFLASSVANNLGFFYMNQISDQERALDYFQKAIRLFKESKEENDTHLAMLYSNIGTCFKESDFYDSTLVSLHKSLQLLQLVSKSDAVIQTEWWNYEVLSDLHLNTEALDSCFYYGQKALSILETGGKSYPDDYQNYHTLGKFYLKAGDYPVALNYFQEGLIRAQEKGDVFRPINAMVNLADVLSKHKSHEAALDTLQMGLHLLCPDFEETDIFKSPPPESFGHKKSALKLIEKRAAIFHRMYEEASETSLLQASLSNYKLATEIIHLLRQDFTGDVSKYFLAEKVLSIYESAIAVAHELYASSGDEKYLADAFHFAEQNKSVLLTESIKDNTAKGFGNLPDSILQKERDLKLEITVIQKKIYEEKKKTVLDKNKIKNLSDELFVSKEAYNDLIGTLEKQFPKYYELKHRNTVASIDDLQKNFLDNNTALLEYFVGEHHLFLFCIQKQKARFFKIERPTDLLASFNQLRGIISKPPKSKRYANDLQNFNQVAFDIYNLLLRDALADIGSKHLIIIPDDLLIYLPFEILLTKDTRATSFSLHDQSYLLKDFDVHYSFSSSMLLNTKDLYYPAQKDFAGFAPSFKNPLVQASRNCGDNDLYSLQCSEQEVSTINELFLGKAFYNLNARKDSFESVVSQYNIIHLATHACVDEMNPDYSRIYFTDDFLSNYDLTNMRIQTNLVVLSACNTNVGPLMKGDGVSSISKGFLLAGCPSILTSLWSVDDCSTSQIMIDFYTSLKQGKTKSQALRQAKLDYLRQADPVNAHPYYWAPFLLSGQNQAISSVGEWPVWPWTIAIIFIALAFLFIRKWRFNQNTRS